MQENSNTTLKVIRPEKNIMTRQKIPYFIGISSATAGAKGISMNLIVIAPGSAPEPHYHKDFETAIYLMEGEVETRYGEGLKQSIIHKKGEFLYIPPGLPHQPVNLSKTEPAIAIVSRNDPNELENVVLYKVGS